MGFRRGSEVESKQRSGGQEMDGQDLRKKMRSAGEERG